MLNIDLNRIALILKIPLSFLYPILFYFLPPSPNSSSIFSQLPFLIPPLCGLFIRSCVGCLHPPKITTYSKILFTRRSIAGYDFFSSSRSFPGVPFSITSQLWWNFNGEGIIEFSRIDGDPCYEASIMYVRKFEVRRISHCGEQIDR